MEKIIFILMGLCICVSCRREMHVDQEVWQRMCTDRFSQDADSLLEIWFRQAVDQKDSALQCSINYVRGRYCQDKYLLFAAQDYYERAWLLAENHADPNLQIKLCRALAEIYRFNRQYEREAYYLKRALSLSVAQGDTLTQIQILKHCGERQKMHHFFQASLGDYREAAKLAYQVNGPDSLYATLCGEQALLYLYLQRNDSALHWIHEAIATQAGDQELYHELLAGLCHHLQGSDSAELYFVRLTERFPLVRRADAYRYMADVQFRAHKIEQAYLLLKKYLFFRDSLDNDRHEFVVERMQAFRSYQAKQQEAENAERQLAIRVLQVYRLGAALLILVIFIGCFYIYIKRRQGRLLLHLAQTERAQAEANLCRREAELRCLKERENNERLEKARLEQRIEYFRRLNEITIPLLMLHRNKAGALHFSDDDWQTLRQNTDACFDQFTVRLKAAFPQLTEEEINFCCLIKMELSLTVLSEIYHIAKGSISRKKIRLKEKMGIRDGTFDDWIALF